MAEQRDVGLRVKRLCRLLNVTKSSYYYWRSQAEKRKLSAKEESALLIKIRKAFHDSQQTYGSPRVWRQLLREGVSCSRKQVAKIMHKNRLISVHYRRKRKFITTTDSSGTKAPTPNLLQRDFSTTDVNQKWVGDVTFILTGEGWLYLASVIDLFSRRIVGWALGTKNDARLTCAAFKMAVLRRQNPKHSFITATAVRTTLAEVSETFCKRATSGPA